MLIAAKQDLVQLVPRFRRCGITINHAVLNAPGFFMSAPSNNFALDSIVLYVAASS